VRHRFVRPQTLRDGPSGKGPLSWSGHQRDHDRTGDQEAGAVAGSYRGATDGWHSMSPCARYLLRPLPGDLCVPTARPCVFLPLDRRGTPGSDPRWSPLYSQPDPRDGSVFSVRFLALVFHMRPLAQARRGLPPDPFGRASGTGKMANPAPLGGGLFRAVAVREMSLATSLSACRASILSMAVFLTSCRVSASSPS